ncbi:MAG: hypothetical protein WB688_21385 [Trebonia sp.]
MTNVRVLIACTATVALADRVALLEGGVIAATGTHRELMAAQPAYAALMSMSEVQV